MMIMEHWWNDIDRGKPKYSEKFLPKCHFSTTNLACAGPGSNVDFCGERSTTNRLTHDKVP
jgi:hypothetical protein